MKSYRVVLPLALILLFLVGCGSVSTPAPAASPAPAPSGTQSGPPAAPKPEKTKLTISVPTSDMAFLPIFVAQDNGFYKAEGLDVTVVSFQGSRENVQAIVSGASDISSGAFTDVIDSVRANQELLAFWGQSNNPTYEWWSIGSIKSMKDAAAKKAKFAISRPGALSDQLTRWVIQQAGYDPDKDVQIVPVGGPAERWAALKSGQVDVGILTAPGLFIAEREGMNQLLALKDYMKGGFALEVWLAKPGFVEQNPGSIIAILRATNKAIDWIANNKEGAAKVVCDRSGQCDTADVVRAIEKDLPFYPTDGAFAPEGEKFLLQLQVDAGDFPPSILNELEKFHDYRFLEMFKENPHWFK